MLWTLKLRYFVLQKLNQQRVDLDLAVAETQLAQAEHRRAHTSPGLSHTTLLQGYQSLFLCPDALWGRELCSKAGSSAPASCFKSGDEREAFLPFSVLHLLLTRLQSWPGWEQDSPSPGCSAWHLGRRLSPLVSWHWLT